MNGWGNSPNHLGNFYEEIRIRVLFSRGQSKPCVWYVGKGDRESGKGSGDALESCVGYGKLFSFENDGRNGERCTYLVCDFNGI
jgi:hypothetical protein